MLMNISISVVSFIIMSKGLIFPFLKDRKQFTFGISKVIIGYQKSSIYFSFSLPASNESIISMNAKFYIPIQYLMKHLEYLTLIYKRFVVSCKMQYVMGLTSVH